MSAVRLSYRDGTIELRGLDPENGFVPAGFVFDRRAGAHRAPASAYAETVLALRREGIELDDEARRYATLETGLVARREPRPYQTEAVAAWKAAKGRGVVVLPTGSGKSHVAMMAIDAVRRASLVVAPTLDLVRQWYDLLRTSFGRPVGVVGGGEHEVHDLTVTTYDSATIHMEHLGNRFGLVVFDECHHLPTESYSLAARFCLAPYRLALTATLERADGREALLDELVGRVIYRRDITELSGRYLADYDTETITVELTTEERERYDAARATYRDFVASQGIRMSSPTGWSDFILRSSISDEGRRAMEAYRLQRDLAFFASAKLEYVEMLLHRHRADRTILFTQDNASAYTISRRFLVPVITHQTRVRERSEILARFADGRYGAVVTSKVLNEGVDVPDANVAIVVSGSGSVREHVQRLGRVLRPREGKRAVLYELVTAATGETFTSERRREHDAYRSP